jgi:transcriptional regulator with XRE-family HTH domain
MSAYFHQNLELALLARGRSQADLAHELEVAKSAVNKWVKGDVRPESARHPDIEKYLDVKLADLEEYHPMVFGEMMGLTRRQVQWQLGDTSSSIPLSNENFSSNPNDFLLRKACGVYVSYMPSWTYVNTLCQRAIQIYFNNDGYYFRERHRFLDKYGETEYIGQVGRSENSFQLIGEEINRIKRGYNRPAEIFFASLQMDLNDANSPLFGIAVGADTVDGGHQPIASPYLALRQPDGTQLEAVVPDIPYVQIDDIKERDILERLEKVRQSWFASKAAWRQQGYEWKS